MSTSRAGQIRCNDWSGRMQMSGQVYAITQTGGCISINPAEDVGGEQIANISHLQMRRNFGQKPSFC
ncbi:hypothetical protein D3C73_338870 [compost metagenome]